MKLEGGCCEGLWREPRHRAAPSYHLWLAELAWAEASSRKPSLMDPELLRSSIFTPPDVWAGPGRAPGMPSEAAALPSWLWGSGLSAMETSGTEPG